ncbi:MAG: DUF1292 domain-containing protein [Bacillota bacterium]|nr:DUF1292 domain-containing protein [Bacillota bacterium]
MDDFGNNFITLTDEDGNEIELEHLDTLEENGETYFAFIEAETNLDSDSELIVLKSTLDENGEELLITVDDDGEYDRIFDLFSERLESYFESGEEDSEEE